jgi:hypothetical protein
MGKRDVDDSAIGKPAHVCVDRRLVRAQMKAALYAMDECDSPLVIEIVGPPGDEMALSPRVSLLQIRLDTAQLMLEVLEVPRLRRRAVGAVEVKLRRRPVQDRANDPGTAVLEPVEVHSPSRGPTRVVEHPRDDSLGSRLELCPQPPEPTR